jgi:hypothetical protein
MRRVQCVIAARSNVARSDLDKRCYVLLVIPIQDELEDDRWVKCKRVAAGSPKWLQSSAIRTLG